jgi:hypothetical protein
MKRLEIGGEVAAWLRCSGGTLDNKTVKGNDRSKEGRERI